MTVDVELFTEADTKDALVVVAFHSTGAAAPIAGSYIRRALALPLVGHVRAPDLGPVVHVSDGIATGPIRIHGGDILCRLDQECQKLFLVSAELPVPISMVDDIAKAVLDWAKGARLVLALDAVVREDGDEAPDVYSIGDRPSALSKISESDAQPLGGGVIVGMTAAVLGRARDHDLDAGALLVEAARSHPDGRAAATLVEALDPLIPQIQVDPGPLLEEAMALESQIQKALREAEETQQRRPSHTFI